MQAPDFLAKHAQSVEKSCLDTLNQRRDVVPARLFDAMLYSLLAGGKRVRPALLLSCFKACGGTDEQLAMPAAVSIEAMHTYSLIHDDLPCMDNDDLRRGKATCHKQFDEETAVLAADALQALSFELLTDIHTDADTRLTMIKDMGIAAGCQGMVGGQMMDILAENTQIDNVLEVERIHLHKTGELLRWSCEAGARLAGAKPQDFAACSRYGKAVGLLFQIADDILDTTASSEALGKSAGKDEAQNKATYVSVLGVQKARELADEMCELALQACDSLNGEAGKELRELALYILKRGQ
ncbi:MAG: polyprenyl synthetase family protein [Mariprofundaceae bacterium]|nr:polyprenyl synthetase family protein [Mariprofundaceae bacterium]